MSITTADIMALTTVEIKDIANYLPRVSARVPPPLPNNEEEAVAYALHANNNHKPGEPYGDSWLFLTEKQRTTYKEIARLAIAALEKFRAEKTSD